MPDRVIPNGSDLIAIHFCNVDLSLCENHEDARCVLDIGTGCGRYSCVSPMPGMGCRIGARGIYRRGMGCRIGAT